MIGRYLVNKRFDSLKSDFQGVKKDILRIEKDLKPKVEAALDGHKPVYEKLTTLEEKVDDVNEHLLHKCSGYPDISLPCIPLSLHIILEYSVEVSILLKK